MDGSTYRFQVEVKSTTTDTVATARDVGMSHIRRWRKMLFVIGFYSREAKRPELQRTLCLTPVDMEPWIRTIENKVMTDFRIAARASRNLTLDDLFDVCGRKPVYSLRDAKELHKSQWSAVEYEAALDTEENGVPMISQLKMLEILQLRAKYIAERGATLNNPHITATHLRRFFGTDREVARNEWARRVREVAEQFVRDHPGHPAILPQSPPDPQSA